MPDLALAPDGSNEVSVSVALSNEAADGTLDVQYAIRPDFQICVAPLVKGVVSVGAHVVINGLNPGTVYYIRMRPRRANGTVENWSNTIAMRTVAGGARDLSAPAIMIEPAIIVVPVPVLSWTAGSQVAGYPVENLGFDGPVAWVSKNANNDTHTFIAEVGDAHIDTIALLSSNAAVDANVIIRGGTDINGTGFVYGPVAFRASPNLPGRPGYHALVRLPQVLQYRFIRVEVTTNSFEDQFHLEHAVFGLNRATKNHSVDKAESVLDLGTIDRTRGGNPIRTIGARMRRVDFDISMLTEAQYEAAYADLDWRVGQVEPVLCIPNSKAGSFLHDRILYGAIRGGRSVNPASPRYTRTFAIESIV